VESVNGDGGMEEEEEDVEDVIEQAY